jgi:hypothetical protein
MWVARRGFRYRLTQSHTGANNKIIGSIINKMRLYYKYLNKKVCISTDFQTTDRLTFEFRIMQKQSIFTDERRGNFRAFRLSALLN